MHPLLDWFDQTAAARPDAPAAADPTLALDYKSFRAVAAGLATQIAAQSTRPRVGILAPTSTACAATLFACWYAGRTPVPLNFLLAPEELAKIVRDADLDLIVTIERFAPAVAPLGLRTLLLGAQTLIPGRPPSPAAASGDVAVLLYTSGTSGDPKGVSLSFDNVVQNVRACIEHVRLDPTQVFLSFLPQFHSFGFTGMTLAPLLLGASVHYLPRFSTATVLHAIAEKKVSVLMAVASTWAALAHSRSATRETFASLRLAISGGEPLPARAADAMEQRFGVTLLEGFGMTESSPVASLNTPWAYRRGSVGRALPGVTLAAMDEAGRLLPPDQDGELVIRGHCVMLGYHNRPDETARTIRDGWLHTGDVGRVDRDGFVFITGRIKEMMIIAGENVFPAEIENVLLAHPAVAEAAVIGVRDDIRGEVPVGFVILKEGATASESEIRDFCRERLAGYKAPRQVRIAADLPRGTTGKILKRKLVV